MSFPSYPSYSDSGIHWLGQVPAEWHTRPLWSLFRRTKRTAYADEELLSVYRDHGVVRKSDRDDNFNNASEDLSLYQLVRQGDLAINKMKAWQGSVAISALRGIVSPAYFVYDKLHNENDRYLHYLIRCDTYVSVYRSISKGIRPNQWDLDPDYHTHLPILLPPPGEQDAIAAFLDRETAKIDALVGEQRRLIALLKEKRQAVISHAVTKGLDPEAPLKDSGVEWLGKVPAHWKVAALKFIATVQIGLAKGKDYGDLETVTVPYIRVANVQAGYLTLDDVAKINVLPDEADKYRLRFGDVLMNEGGDFDKLGRGDVWRDQIAGCIHQNHVFAVRPTGVSPTWLNLVASSDYAKTFFVLRSKQTTNLASISSSNLMELPVIIPPVEQQTEIENYIAANEAKFDGLLSAAQEAIDLLLERRAALISAAVTGKIDVRGAAKVLSFPVGRARARGMIATEIIERSAHQTTFGRVKLQKIAYLAEANVGLTELKGNYLREAAGPLDREMIHEMEREAGALAGIRVEQPHGAGSAVAYRLGDRRGAHRQDLAALLGGRAAKFDKLIEDIGTIDTKGAEAVATLYAVWNDALIDGERPADIEIKLAVLTEWHPEKAKKFHLDELQVWLDWMRRHGLVPIGTGPKTSTGRLFA